MASSADPLFNQFVRVEAGAAMFTPLVSPVLAKATNSWAAFSSASAPVCAWDSPRERTTDPLNPLPPGAAVTKSPTDGTRELPVVSCPLRLQMIFAGAGNGEEGVLVSW